MRILLLENNVEVANDILDVLNKIHTGTIINHCISIEEAYIMTNKLTYDIMIIDQYLQGGKGIEFAKELRTHNTNCN